MASLYASLVEHDPDRLDAAVTALRVHTCQNERETPFHSHRKGQLVVALHGAVTCETAQGMWIVPPQSAVWVPPGVPHSNRVTLDGQLCFLFIAPQAASMPDQCCTLALSPLLVQMICHLAEQRQDYAPHERTARLAAVLVEELEHSQRHALPLHLPVPQHSRLRAIARHLAEQPADRSTVAELGTAPCHERAQLCPLRAGRDRHELRPLAPPDPPDAGAAAAGLGQFGAARLAGPGL